MSERKVLNKYYPPDFDPSKIPKVKGNRNATFIIRVMAPCNMRCTTCGEYIYKVHKTTNAMLTRSLFDSKGRKFNARKEDVDDMDYLGLRIYRQFLHICYVCTLYGFPIKGIFYACTGFTSNARLVSLRFASAPIPRAATMYWKQVNCFCNSKMELSSGATRNFEALKRAEEQLEREEIAYREELENNPMKLLEERTAARQ